MTKFINKETGDVIPFETWKAISPEARDKFDLIPFTPQPPTPITKEVQVVREREMSLGEGIATTAAVVVMSPVLILGGLFSLFD